MFLVRKLFITYTLTLHFLLLFSDTVVADKPRCAAVPEEEISVKRRPFHLISITGSVTSSAEVIYKSVSKSNSSKITVV